MCLIVFQRNELPVCLFGTCMLISNNFSRILPNVFNSNPPKKPINSSVYVCISIINLSIFNVIRNDSLNTKFVNMKTFFSSKIKPIVICYSSDKKNIIVVFNIKIKPIKSKKGAIPIWVPSSLKNTCALIWALCV